MGHSIIIVHSSSFFFLFFCPDLDLCGLPAWLLPWQHLEPSSSCWPYVFTEAPACSSLPRGFASPSKVSLYRLTKTPLTAGIVIRVSFTLFVFFPPLSRAHTQKLTHTRAHINTSSYTSSLYICKEGISCSMSNSATLETKGGYYVWLGTGSALRQSFSPHPKSNTHYILTCLCFLCLTWWHEEETPEIWYFRVLMLWPRAVCFKMGGVDSGFKAFIVGLWDFPPPHLE